MAKKATSTGEDRRAAQFREEALRTLLPTDTAPAVFERYRVLPEQAAEQSFGLEPEVVLLDTETTGLDPAHDEIIEIALVRMRGPEIVDRWSSLVHPSRTLTPEISRITGITGAMLADAPAFSEIAATVTAFIGDADLVAHNARFDRAFVTRVLPDLTNTWIDSIVMAQIGLPRLMRFRQVSLAQWLAPEAARDAHRAYADTEVLAAVWRVALCGMAALDFAVLARIAQLPRLGQGGERAWIEQVLGARTDAPSEPLSLVRLRRAAVREDKADPLYDAFEVRMNFPEETDIMDHLRDRDGKAAVYEGFEARPSQVQMANYVYDAFVRSQFLTVEAGTGVGKSLAYLLPAALVALENNVTIGIATRSNNLTDQLLTREIPLLEKALGRTLRATGVKGYENYVCLRKVEAALQEETSSPTLAHLLAWIAQSPWGDMARIMGIGRDNKAFVATHQECTNKRCRFYPNLCYLHGARRRALSSHLVVTNHSLLFRDSVSPSRILPPIRYWIVDEAHSIETEARDQLSLTVDLPRLASVLATFNASHKGLASRLDTALAAVAGAQGEKSEIALVLVRLSGRVGDAATVDKAFEEAVASFVRAIPAGETARRECWVNDELRETAAWGEMVRVGTSLYHKLDAAHTTAGQLGKALLLEEKLKDTDIAAELNGFLYDLEATLDALGVFLGEPEENLVYSVRTLRSGRPLSLVAAPLEVGGIIEENLYGKVHSLVYTSATMAVADSFDHFAASVGLDRVEQSRRKDVVLATSYDLANQMRIFVVADMPDPRDGRYVDALAAFAERVHIALDGGVLSLFTNRRDMEAVYDRLAHAGALSEQGLEVLLQSSGGSNLALGHAFVADRRRSLFALRSFWEGFDARGDTLQCVLIPKLPFAQPGTPLANERTLREGSKAWSHYDLPEAIISLRQAIGRLIRSEKDRGFVILADSRLVSKGYGKRVLRSLPVPAEIMIADAIIDELRNR